MNWLSKILGKQKKSDYKFKDSILPTSNSSFNNTVTLFFSFLFSNNKYL